MCHSILVVGRFVRRFTRAAIACVALTALLGDAAHAAPILLLPITLPGNSSHDGWTSTGLDNVNNPPSAGYPTAGTYTNPWPAPIASDVGGDGQFMKTGGGGYPLSPGAGGGVYTFFAPGSFDVYDLTPVGGLSTVVFQIHFEYQPPVAFDIAPVLNYNGGAQGLTPVAFPITSFDRLFQWDLTSIGPITDFEVAFSLDQHHQIFETRLDQSDLFTSVSEPSSMTLAALALAGTVLFRRARKEFHG